MKVLSPFLAGFAMAMAMNTATDDGIALWITLFFVSIIGTIAFNSLENLNETE